MMMCLVCQSHQLLEHSGCQVDESGVVFSLLHLHHCPCIFLFTIFFFCFAICFHFVRACTCVCLAGIIGGRLPLSLSCRGLDEMRGPSVRHQGRPSEIVRPTCNSAEISP